MPEDLAFYSQTQKLIRCRVTGPGGSTSLRFVELESFQLWRHMMHTKHQLVVGEEQLCVWISETEFAAKQELYSRAGRQQPVTRLIVLLYDATTTYCHTIQRFAPLEDAEIVRRSLIECVPAEQRGGDRFELHALPGQCIEHDTRGAPMELILGLRSRAGGSH